jgi:hypothetical protein
MDQSWIPASLHKTLREVLGFHLRVTLGYYYRWAATHAKARAERRGLGRVIEMGAGAAGFSETLARLVEHDRAPLQVDVSDLRPDVARYRQLERDFPGVIHPHLEPLNILAWQPPAGGALVVMSAAFHHIPRLERPRILRALGRRDVIIFESVTRTVPSMLGCAIGFLPALATPLYFVGLREGRWRRFFWCWIVPVAPIMVAWDGVISCLRCWTEDEWRAELAALDVDASSVAIERRRFSHMIGW